MHGYNLRKRLASIFSDEDRKGKRYLESHNDSEDESENKEYVIRKTIEKDSSDENSENDESRCDAEEKENIEGEVEIDDGEDLDDFIVQDEKEYFEPDNSALVNEIANRLESKYNISSLGVGKNKLIRSIKKIINRNQDSIFDDGTVRPGDKNWKLGVEPECISDMEKELQQIREYNDNRMPSMKKILESTIPRDTKTRIIVAFDVLQTFDPYSREWQNAILYLQYILDVEKLSSDAAKEKYTEFCTYRDKEEVTLERILKADVEMDVKLRAYELLLVAEECGIYSRAWLDCIAEIRHLLKMEEDPLPLELKSQEVEMKKLYKKVSPNNLLRTLLELHTNQETKLVLYEMYTRLNSLTPGTYEYDTLLGKLQTALTLPYSLAAPIPIASDIPHILLNLQRELDNTLYGMHKVKQELLLLVNDKLTRPDNGYIIVLKSKAGMGKTSICLALSRILGKPMEKISLGGSQDSTMFKGDRSVWSNSSPSIILQFLRKSKRSDGIIVWDELDKLGMEYKGMEVQNSLLQVLDASQNTMFKDDYLPELNHDISRLWHLGTINDDRTIHSTLKDRMRILKLDEYNREDFLIIMQKYLMPKLLRKRCINEENVTITREACEYIYSLKESEVKETGVRPLEKVLDQLVSRLNFLKNICGKDLSTLRMSFMYIPYVEPMTITQTLLCKILPDITRGENTQPFYIS